MSLPVRSSFVAAAAFVLLAVTACQNFRAPGSGAPRTAATTAAPPADAVAIQVRNEYGAEMEVYVIAEGLPTRLGSVASGANIVFTLDRSFVPSSDLRIVAAPLGGNGRASSGPLSVSSGQVVQFTISSLLRASSATVR